jgi:hypothetical protein
MISYRLDNQDLFSRCGRDFSSCCHVQTGSGPIQWLLGIKGPEYEADWSPLGHTKIKTAWSFTFTLYCIQNERNIKTG